MLKVGDRIRLDFTDLNSQEAKDSPFQGREGRVVVVSGEQRPMVYRVELDRPVTKQEAANVWLDGHGAAWHENCVKPLPTFLCGECDTPMLETTDYLCEQCRSG
jgi:hypothetical protein